MGTRGCYGFVLPGGEEKLTYNCLDSYPSGLGQHVIDFLKETPLREIRQIAERIVMVDELKSKPTDSQIRVCKKAGLLNTSVGNQTENEWYCLLRKSQGDLGVYKNPKILWMIDGRAFVADSLFCEWAYIINLETNMLEIYRGFNDDPTARGRYASCRIPQDRRNTQYFGIVLIDEVPLKGFRRLSKSKIRELMGQWEAVEV